LCPFMEESWLHMSTITKWEKDKGIPDVANLVAVLLYIAYFAFAHKIIMLEFLAATLFMVALELRLFIKVRIFRQI